MRLSLKQLKSLRVETRSGLSLGHVHDVVFELDGQLVVQYVVTSSLWQREQYLVGREQVVRFTEEKMIVDDTVEKSPAAVPPKKKPFGISPEPVAMRE